MTMFRTFGITGKRNNAPTSAESGVRFSLPFAAKGSVVLGKAPQSEKQAELKNKRAFV